MTTMTNRTNTTTHFYVGETVADPLTCDHESGETSLRLVEGVWFTGTLAEWRGFANRIANLVEDMAPEVGDQFTDEADFNESRASDEVWS